MLYTWLPCKKRLERHKIVDTCLCKCYFGGNLIFKTLSRLVKMIEVKEGVRRVLCVRCYNFKWSKNACCFIFFFCNRHVFTPCAIIPVCISTFRGIASLFVFGALWLQGFVFWDLDLLSSAATGRTFRFCRSQICLIFFFLGHRVCATTVAVSLSHWARPQSVHLKRHRGSHQFLLLKVRWRRKHISRLIVLRLFDLFKFFRNGQISERPMSMFFMITSRNWSCFRWERIFAQLSRERASGVSGELSTWYAWYSTSSLLICLHYLDSRGSWLCKFIIILDRGGNDDGGRSFGIPLSLKYIR